MATALTTTLVAAALVGGRKGVYKDFTDVRATGLMLRVRPAGARWTVRGTLHGVQKRYDLGPATDARTDDGSLICLDTARARAMEIRAVIATERDPAVILAFLRGGKTAADQLRQAETDALLERRKAAEAEAAAQTWTWEAAKLAYFAEVHNSNRPATLRDYRQKLSVPEFDMRFAGRLVCEITDVEVAEAYDELFDKDPPKYGQADGSLRVIKAFWSFLASAGRRSKTGVEKDLRTVDFRARKRDEEGDPNKKFNPDDEVSDAPVPVQLGIALAIARCPGALEPFESNALMLLLASCQRRRAVMGASTDRFRRYPTAPDEQAWFVAPYFRKTRSKRGAKSHLVPVLGFGADAVAAQDKIAGDSRWLFHNGRKGDNHRNVNTLNKLLDALPGVDWSPHGPRYSLADFVATLQGFEKSEAALILDHSEGTEPSDVTATYYTSSPQISKKRAIMEAWMDHLNDLSNEAIAANPRLQDAIWIRKRVFYNRFGKAAFRKRAADRRQRGRPFG